MAAPYAGMLKITAIKTLRLDNVGDGSLVPVETDAGIAGKEPVIRNSVMPAAYGEGRGVVGIMPRVKSDAAWAIR